MKLNVATGRAHSMSRKVNSAMIAVVSNDAKGGLIGCNNLWVAGGSWADGDTVTAAVKFKITGGSVWGTCG